MLLICTATLWQRPEGAGWGPDQNLRILSNSKKFTERLCIIEVAVKSSRPARRCQNQSCPTST
jgi:hypothetical protein